MANSACRDAPKCNRSFVAENKQELSYKSHSSYMSNMFFLSISLVSLAFCICLSFLSLCAVYIPKCLFISFSVSLSAFLCLLLSLCHLLSGSIPLSFELSFSLPLYFLSFFSHLHRSSRPGFRLRLKVVSSLVFLTEVLFVITLGWQQRCSVHCSSG